MTQPFFIFGMRRSGTSILRKIIERCDGVGEVLFEPSKLWQAVKTINSKRYRGDKHSQGIVKAFKDTAGLHGAKFAVNPSIDWFSWRLLADTFDANFVFIHRNRADVYASYAKIDKKRGVVPEFVHEWFHDYFNAEWSEYCAAHPDRACIVSYEALLKSPVSAMMPVKALLGVSLDDDALRGMIKTPANTAGMEVCR